MIIEKSFKRNVLSKLNYVLRGIIYGGKVLSSPFLLLLLLFVSPHLRILFSSLFRKSGKEGGKGRERERDIDVRETHTYIDQLPQECAFGNGNSRPFGVQATEPHW